VNDIKHSLLEPELVLLERFDEKEANNKLEHICYKCEKIFSFKSSLKRHEVICKADEETYKCLSCSKIFSNRKTMNKHKKYIKCESTVKESKYMTRHELLDEIEKLKTKESSAGINILNDNSRNNIDNSTNTNNGIILNHYLKPNLDFMSNMDYVHDLLKKSKYKTNKVIMKCVRDTYNSVERPENKSIKINLKSGFAEVNIGERTISVPNDDACYDIIYNMSKDIKRFVEDYSYEYNMTGSKVDDVIDQMEDVECDNVDTSKLYGSYVKAGLM
jgi:DNA-directed RNA polymerase subunit RPC12/RpoP